MPSTFASVGQLCKRNIWESVTQDSLPIMATGIPAHSSNAATYRCTRHYLTATENTHRYHISSSFQVHLHNKQCRCIPNVKRENDIKKTANNKKCEEKKHECLQNSVSVTCLLDAVQSIVPVKEIHLLHSYDRPTAVSANDLGHTPLPTRNSTVC